MSCRDWQVGCEFDVSFACHKQASCLRVMIQQERHQILRQDRDRHAGWILVQASFSNPACWSGMLRGGPLTAEICGETP